MSLGKNKIISSAVKLVIISVVAFLLYKEFRHINIRELFGLLNRLSDWERGAILVMGLSAFMLIISYDFIMAKFFELKLSPKTIFKIGWNWSWWLIWWYGTCQDVSGCRSRKGKKF